MRLWLIEEFGHGGIGRYAVDVSNFLGDTVDTVVATSAMGPVDGLQGASVEWFPRFAENSLGKGLGGLVGLGRMARSVRRGDAAWVPLGIRPVFELALVAALRARGARVVVTVHNRGPHGRGESPTIIRAARLAHAVVVHTDAVEAWAQAHGLASARLPFPPPQVQGNADDRLTREDLGVPPGVVLVSMLGYLYHYKGVDLLIDALLEAKRRVPDLPVHVLLAGRLPSPETGAPVLAALDRVVGSPDVTVRPGWLGEDEFSTLLSLTDVIALPYREIDNSGSGALARSRGLPGLVSDLSGLREIFGPAALYVPREDVDALAGALVRLPELLPGLRSLAADRPQVDLVSAYRAFIDGFCGPVPR